LVIVGGDDSNTNAAYLAEHFAANGVTTTVVGLNELDSVYP
jgi:pyrophosphate--fructose-6-phosphate 1-phosphotransferase